MDALEYKAYCKEFKSVERYLRKYGASQDIVNYNICNLRGYRLEQMNDILTEAGFIYIEDNSVYDALEGNVPEELGLFKNGQFLLSGRFIFPVRDMLGNTLAMIGWFPDEYLCSLGAKYMNAALLKRGIKIWTATSGSTFDRGKGIHEFVDYHKKNIDSWIVIDDSIFEDYDEEILHHLCQTNYHDGFDEDSIVRALKIIQNDSSAPLEA